MKAIYLLTLLVVFSSCAYQSSHHTFAYHGTDAISTNRQFYYVANGITGVSQAEYSLRGGGHVREGLVADAKRNLRTNFPLGPNQAYANLSIDIMETRTGKTSSSGPMIKKIRLSCIVSADVIEYCDEVPDDRVMKKSTVIYSDEELINNRNLDQSGDQDAKQTGEEVSEETNNADSLNPTNDWDGKSVWYGGADKKNWDPNKPNTGIAAVVIETRGEFYVIEFTDKKGFTRKKYEKMDSKYIVKRIGG
jgi:hypothetical protein